MKALAIETATEACSVALHIDGATHELHEIVPRKHTERLLPMAQQLLDEAGLTIEQLDFITFGRGPGAFTGVRIAASAAQGMALGADLPVVPVSTLAVLAQGCINETDATTILSVIDARMGEVYWSIYKPNGNGLAVLAQSECVVHPDEVVVDLESDIDISGEVAAVGSAWGVYKDQLSAKSPKQISCYLDDIYPHAENLMQLALPEFENGGGVAPELALPVYLRDNVAKKSTKKIV